MKTKRIIYFALILVGAMVMGFGDNFLKKEYALCIGIVLLMFGSYKSTQVGADRVSSEKENPKQEP